MPGRSRQRLPPLVWALGTARLPGVNQPLWLMGLELQPHQASSPRAVGSCRQTTLVPQAVFVLVLKPCPFLRTRVFKMDQPTPFFTDKKQAQPENGRAQAVWHGPNPGCLALLHLETESWTLLATVAISCTEDGMSQVRQACLLFQSPWLKGGSRVGPHWSHGHVLLGMEGRMVIRESALGKLGSQRSCLLS